MCWRLLPACVCHPVVRFPMQVSEMEQMVESVMQGNTEMEGRLQRSEEALGESQAACTKAETRLAEAMKRVRVCAALAMLRGCLHRCKRAVPPLVIHISLNPTQPLCASLYLLCTSSVPPLHLCAPLFTSSFFPRYPLVPDLTAECRPRADP